MAYCVWVSRWLGRIRTGSFLILFFVLLDRVYGTGNDDWRISAANFARYYHFQKDRSDSVATRFQFDLYISDFYAGAWYEAKHPGSPAAAYDSITQRYLGWESKNLNIRVGNFYHLFDRGLILNAYRNEDVFVDVLLDGLLVSGRYEYLDFDLLSARSKTPNGLRPTLSGARLKLRPLGELHFGGAVVRLVENDMVLGDIRSNLRQVNARLNYRFFDGYVEQAYHDGYYIDYATMPFEARKRPGEGTYASVIVSPWRLSTLFEYKNYKFLTYPNILDPGGNFNQPPAVNHQERSLYSQYTVSGERGWRLAFNLGISEYWAVVIDYAEAKSRDQFKAYMNEKYLELRGGYGDANQFLLSFDRLEHTMKNEITAKLEINQAIDGLRWIILNGSLLKYELLDDPTDTTDYLEKYLAVEFASTPRVSVIFGASWSDRKWLPDDPEKDPAQMTYVEAIVHMAHHDVSLFLGGQRGGYVCSGGICMLRPTFRGFRATIVSRL